MGVFFSNNVNHTISKRGYTLAGVSTSDKIFSQWHRVFLPRRKRLGLDVYFDTELARKPVTYAKQIGPSSSRFDDL